MSEFDLLSCPFCGKEEAQAAQNPSTNYWGVICMWCESDNFGGCYFSKQEAVTAWNTRAPIAYPTPTMFDAVARELEQAIAGDAQEALDKIAVMDWMLEHGGEVWGARDITLDALNGFGEEFDSLQEAAAWVRQQGGDNGE